MTPDIIERWAADSEANGHYLQASDEWVEAAERHKIEHDWTAAERCARSAAAALDRWADQLANANFAPPTKTN